jgi:hypothetical protein
MEIIPDKRKLVGLVEQAQVGKICLPDFQRDFVWRKEEVADLVRSVLRGYFIGSLLLLRSDPSKPPFSPVYLRGSNAPQVTPLPELLILDGQQRLTSLLYALTAPELPLKDSTKIWRFYIDLDLFTRDPYDDDIVLEKPITDLGGLDDPRQQYSERKIPCTALLTADTSYKWMYGFDDWSRETDQEIHKEFREGLRDSWTKAITAFQSFEVPLVELPQVSENNPESLGSVCAIFEKLNSTGVELSVYDLLTARLYRNGIRLHELWEEACGNFPRIAKYSEGKADRHKFGVLVLRTLALMRGLDPKPRLLINLSPENFREDWEKAVAAIETAFDMIELVDEHGFGVFAEKWLPGFGLIPTLASLRSVIEAHGMGEAARADLRRWYWCSVFLERYSSAVDSKSRKDYVELTQKWLAAGPEPEIFQEAESIIGSPGFKVRNSTSHASSVYSGVFCLLAIEKARDWRREENIQLQKLEDHHIVPKAFLKRHGITKRLQVNSIVNRTLISDETNQLIRDKAPSEYLTNSNIIEQSRKNSLLKRHFIDHDGLATLESIAEDLSDDVAEREFENFLDFREERIIIKIREFCNVSPMK